MAEINARVLPGAARFAFVSVGLAPWIVPLARAFLPLGALGEAIDAAFVTMCHRLPERTISLAGVPMPLCSRCAGVFLGVAVGALAAWPRFSTRVWRLVIAASGVAMLLDVVTQDLDLHPVWHTTRLATGLAFGYALAAACLVSLKDEAGARLGEAEPVSGAAALPATPAPHAPHAPHKPDAPRV